MNTKKRYFLRVAKLRVKISLLVFMSNINIDLTLKRSSFLFLLCFKIAVIHLIPMPSTKSQLFPNLSASKFDTSIEFTGFDIGCNQYRTSEHAGNTKDAKQLGKKVVSLSRWLTHWNKLV